MALNRAALSDAKRCIRLIKRTNKRCTNPKMLGLEYCWNHSRNNAKANDKKHQTAKTTAEITTRLSRLERFTGLIDANDPEARGDVALVTELRRTVQRIRVLDEWIVELKEDELGWGKASAEEHEMTGWSETGDDSYKQTTYEARVNVYVEWQMKERQHLAQLSSIWIKAGFKARELDLQERQVISFNNAIIEMIGALGHDPTDPGVRAIVARVMLGLAPTRPIEAETVDVP